MILIEEHILNRLDDQISPEVSPVSEYVTEDEILNYFPSSLLVSTHIPWASR